MPPRLRRPAAAPAAAGERRARAPLLRRPAAAEEEAERDDLGGEIDCSLISLEQCHSLQDVVVTQGSYWDAPLQVALRIKEFRVKDGHSLLTAQVLGTQNEDLLKWATGQPGQLVRAHLCPRECAGTPHEDGLIHIKKLKRLGRDREEWMGNMIPEERHPPGQDELAEMREDRERGRRAREQGGLATDRPAGSPPSPEDEKKKDRKKKKSSSHRKKKGQVKLEPRKEVAAVLGATGADPDPKVRKRLRRKAAHIVKRKTKESKGDSSSSSTTSSSSVSGDPALFGSSNRVHTVGRKIPGVLVTAALEEASESLITQEGGLYDTQGGALPPLFARYFRQQLSSRMSPAMRREAQTISHMLDLGLRGRIAESLDIGAQRLKALEMMMAGAHFTVAQQVELLPVEESTMSSLSEFTEAARRAREDGRARLEASRPYGTRGAAGARSDEWQKGGGKKGQGKNKGNKGDPRKGDQEKGETKKPKGG